MTDEEKKEFEEFLEWKKQKKEAEQQKVEQQNAEQQKTEQQRAEQSTTSTLSVSIPDKASEEKEQVVENTNQEDDDKVPKIAIKIALGILVVALILIFADIKCSNKTSTAYSNGADSAYTDTTTDIEGDGSSYDESLDNGSSYTPTVEVKNSGWDGSVKQVKDYLQSTLRDPDSYESIEWSEVKRKDDGYYVRHKYRAKNGFGGYVVANQLFHLDFDGNVVGVTDLY